MRFPYPLRGRGDLSGSAQLTNGFPPVWGWLIGRGDFRQRALEIIQREVLTHFPRIEARARHEGDLVEQEIADGADFAFVIEPRAQHPRPGERAPVAELRKFQNDDGKP